MKVAVIGTGGAGGLLGAKLRSAGTDVCFLARGESLRALRTNGLFLKSICGDILIPPPLPASPNGQDLGSVDVILVATKATNITDVIPHVRAMLSPSTLVVTIQNGIQIPQSLAQAVGLDRIYGGVCRFISFRKEYGVIHHVGVEPTVALGPFEIKSSASYRLKAIEFTKTLTKAGIVSSLVSDIYSAMWEKLALVASLSIVGALSRVPIGDFRSIPNTRRMVSEIIAEVIETGTRAGIEVSSTCSAETLAFIDSMTHESTPSMQRDIAEGRPSELEYIVGEVERLARTHQVKAPHLEFAYAMLLPAEVNARCRQLL